MKAPLGNRFDRRQFLQHAGLGVAALWAFGRTAVLRAQAAEDPPNTHNMLVVGERTIYLSHLPMFDGLDQSKSRFRSPHRYQMILEATFAVDGKDAGEIYRKDREKHPATRIYTLMPENFVLSRLFTPPDKPQVGSFTAQVFRGHLEQGGTRVPGLEKVSVNVSRVVHARMFEPKAEKPTALEYILFGKGSELFLAHAIFLPPDFDQVLAVKLPGQQLDDKDLGKTLRLAVPDRKNVAAQRLKEKQQVQATLANGAGRPATKVQVDVGNQYYFEEGELLVPPTFKPTAEEMKK